MNNYPPVGGAGRPPYESAPQNGQQQAQNPNNCVKNNNGYSNMPSVPPVAVGGQAPAKIGAEGAAPAYGASGAAGANMAGSAADAAPPHPVIGLLGDTAPISAAPKQREPFSPTRADGIFAIASIVLGVLYYYWMMRSGLLWQGWGASLFVLGYSVLGLGYAFAKRLRPGLHSWFWLGLLLLCGGSYALWPGGSLVFWRGLFLFFVALYWCCSLFCVQLQGKTGSWLPLDLVNMWLVVPLQNYALAVRSVRGLLPHSKKTKDTTAAQQNEPQNGEAAEDGGTTPQSTGNTRSILLGLALFVPFLFIVIPLLLQADSGGFAGMLTGIGIFVDRLINAMDFEMVLALAVGLLVGCYLFGLLAGAAHRRYVKKIDIKKQQRRLQDARVLPGLTAVSLLAAAVTLYAVFILCQIPYFFSAFRGTLGGGYVNYAEFARDGFFELCTIASINLVFLVLVHFLGRRDKGGAAVKWLTVALSGVTLILLATAFSKMALYAGRFGLTSKRLLTCVFMLFLCVVWVGVILLQFKKLPLVRISAAVGSIMFCALCVGNTDGLIMQYNTARFMDGSLTQYSGVWWDHHGIGGAEAAWTLAQQTEDPNARWQIVYPLYNAWDKAQNAAGTSDDTVAYAQLRNAYFVPDLRAAYREGIENGGNPVIGERW